MTVTAPLELTEHPQWVAWRLEEREGKPTKVPYCVRNGHLASTIDPRTWATFTEAAAFHAAHDWTSGVGYVLAATDPYVGVDLDHCRDTGTGKLEPWARSIVRRLNSYTEITPSQTGLRIFVRGMLPLGGRKKGPVEMYSQARFLTVTGQHLGGTPTTIEDRRAEIAALHAEYFPPRLAPETNGTHAAREPLNLADADLLLKARNATNGAAFWALWNGDWSAYSSQSEADLALCSHLAFYAQGNAGRIDGLFRQSGLMRAKWDERHYSSGETYGERTIALCLEGKTEFYEPGSGSPDLTVVTPDGYIVDRVSGELVSPWQSLGELVRLTPERPAEMVQGMLWSGRTHWAYSAPSVGKTLFLSALLMHIAAGKPFHGREVTQGAVLLIEEDSPLAVVAEYVEMLADIYELDLDALPFWINRAQGFRLTDEAGLSAIEQAIAQAPEQPTILALDACERLVPSEAFSSKELDPLSRLLQRTIARGMTNVVIDHTRKQSGAAGPQSEPLDLLYGGRSKSAISDVMLYFSGSIRTSARVTCTKFRGQLPAPFDLSFDSAAGFTVRTRTRDLTDNERKIMEVFNNSRIALLAIEDVIAATEMKERTLFRALSRLVQDGVLSHEQGGRSGLYRLAPGYGGLFQ